MRIFLAEVIVLGKTRSGSFVGVWATVVDR